MKLTLNAKLGQGEGPEERSAALEAARTGLANALPDDYDVKVDAERGRLVVKSKRHKGIPAPVDTLTV